MEMGGYHIPKGTTVQVRGEVFNCTMSHVLCWLTV